MSFTQIFITEFFNGNIIIRLLFRSQAFDNILAAKDL